MTPAEGTNYYSTRVSSEKSYNVRNISKCNTKEETYGLILRDSYDVYFRRYI